MNGSFSNRNIEAIEGKGSWSAYVMMVLGFRLAMGFFFDSATAWNVVHVVHTVSTFMLLHWAKGTPWANVAGDQGANETFWEQIDHGRQNTPNRKFFVGVMFALYICAMHAGRYTVKSFIFNSLCLAVVGVPKLAVMHHVRLFNVNKD